MGETESGLSKTQIQSCLESKNLSLTEQHKTQHSESEFLPSPELAIIGVLLYLEIYFSVLISES